MRAHTLSRQLREGNLFAEQCPSREVLKHVTSRWGVLILVALRDGTHRFSDLRRKMGGVSEKMLVQSLQALEQDGFLNRVSYPVVPPHVEYSLTPLGEQVSDKVAALADWIELNLPRIGAAGPFIRWRLALYSACQSGRINAAPYGTHVTCLNPPDKWQNRYHRRQPSSSDTALSL